MQHKRHWLIELFLSLFGLDPESAARRREAAERARQSEREAAARRREATERMERESADRRQEATERLEREAAARRRETAERMEREAAVFSTLDQSRQLKLSVRIKYTNNDELTSERTIDVFGLGNGYLDAYCHLRGELRIFRIGRVEWPKITNDSFVISPAYAPSDWIKSGKGEIRD